MQKESYLQSKEQIKDKSSEEIERMITEMNGRKASLYGALEALYKKFMQESKSKFEKYSELMGANQLAGAGIEGSKRKIQRLRTRLKQAQL